MHNRSSSDEPPKKKKAEDANELAARIVEEATSEDPKGIEERDEEGGKNPHAQALGRLGGLKGGKARAAKLTPEQRREIAQKAAEARWKKSD